MNQATRVKTTKKEGFSDTAMKPDNQGPFCLYVNGRPIYKGQILLTTIARVCTSTCGGAWNVPKRAGSGQRYMHFFSVFHQNNPLPGRGEGN